MDILDWDQALALAKRYAPEYTSQISLEYGGQLEIDGRYGEAHTQYDQALKNSSAFLGTSSEFIEHEKECRAGLIRMTFALGDLSAGMAHLKDCSDRRVLDDCILILENLKQYTEAGLLLEKEGLYDRAAECWIKGMHCFKRC
jgi:tetratricopeptide (TPR) repeat protein